MERSISHHLQDWRDNRRIVVYRVYGLCAGRIGGHSAARHDWCRNGPGSERENAPRIRDAVRLSQCVDFAHVLRIGGVRFAQVSDNTAHMADGADIREYAATIERGCGRGEIGAFAECLVAFKELDQGASGNDAVSIRTGGRFGFALIFNCSGAQQIHGKHIEYILCGKLL